MSSVDSRIISDLGVDPAKMSKVDQESNHDCRFSNLLSLWLPDLDLFPHTPSTMFAVLHWALSLNADINEAAGLRGINAEGLNNFDLAHAEGAIGE